MTEITGTITESEWDGTNGWCTIITTAGKVRLPFFSHELAVAASKGNPVSVTAGPADPAAFWSSLTPERRLALAKAAPKVAGKWRVTFRDEDGDNWNRSLPGSLDANAWGGRWEISDNAELIHSGDCDSLSAAQSACDAELIRLGYVLEPGE